MIINTHELAWSAGFFDGEGSTSIHRYIPKRQKSENVAIRVTISQAHPEVLHRFSNAINGMGLIKGPYEVKGGRKKQWRFSSYGYERCQQILSMLWPWLGSIKKKQAKKALITMRKNIRRVGRPNNIFCCRGHDQGIYAHIPPNGRRVCRECERLRSLAAYYRRKGDLQEVRRVMEGQHTEDRRRWMWRNKNG